MARSRINSKSRDLVQDRGAVLVSVVRGEQIHMDMTLNWLTNLTGYTLTAKIVEADSASLDHTATDGSQLPTAVKTGGQVVTLPIIDTTVSDNAFVVVIPETLVDNFTTKPLPEKPSYGWIGLEVKDNASGNAQKIWKPFRGLVEILYSPSEA